MQVAAEPASQATSAPAAGISENQRLRQLIEQQMQLLARQLDVLADDVAGTQAAVPAQAAISTPTPQPSTDGSDTPSQPEPLQAPMDAAHPIAPGARLGRNPEGSPAWFLADPARPGKYLKVGT
jgi:hypothetical protein